jgi:hypothetical protein
VNTIKFLIVVSMSLLIGLVYHQVVNAYIDPEKYRSDPELYNSIVKYNKLEKLYDYCYAHASDSANPIQDLIDKGLIDSEYTDCKTVKSTFDALDTKIVQLLAEFY